MKKVAAIGGTLTTAARRQLVTLGAGCGEGTPAIADMVIELRHREYETPDPWDRGNI